MPNHLGITVLLSLSVCETRFLGLASYLSNFTITQGTCYTYSVYRHTVLAIRNLNTHPQYFTCT